MELLLHMSYSLKKLLTLLQNMTGYFSPPLSPFSGESGSSNNNHRNNELLIVRYVSDNVLRA